MGHCSSCVNSNFYRFVVVKRASWRTVNRSALILTLIFLMGCGWSPDEYDHKYKLPLKVGWWGSNKDTPELLCLIKMSSWEDSETDPGHSVGTTNPMEPWGIWVFSWRSWLGRLPGTG